MNRGLATSLGITEENSKFPNPYDKSRYIIWLFDVVHLFKNLRNHFLDDVVQLPCGMIVTVDDFYDLLEVVQAEITSGFHLSEKDLQVSGNDRQDAGSAVRLLSDRTAALLKHHFPNVPAKQALSKAIDLIEKFFKIVTSRVLLDKSDEMKCALRMHLEKQTEIMLKFKDWIKSTTFSDNEFQQGFVISISGLFALHLLFENRL